MTRKYLFTFFVLVFVILLHSGSKYVAQVQDMKQSSQELEPFASLNFEITSPSQTVLLLQPIPITFKLTNSRNRAALGYKRIGFGKSPMYVYVKKTGTDNRVLISALHPIHELTRYSNVPIESGESVDGKELITLGLAKYFGVAGSYEVQAVLTNHDGTELIESNIVVINVQEPTGANRSAYNLIRNSSFRDYLFSGLEFDDTKSILERLKTLYPNSPYTRNATFVLGENYFHDGRFVPALANLVRLENDNEFVHAEKVRKYLAEIRLTELNRQKEEQKP